MKIDKFETREEDGKLHVYVEVPHAWKLANIPKITLNTQDICVILDEEKSVQSKPKRAKRTRSSTKKVSTEE